MLPKYPVSLSVCVVEVYLGVVATSDFIPAASSVWAELLAEDAARQERAKWREIPCEDCGKPVDCRRTRNEHPICHPCRRIRNPPQPQRSRPPLQPCGTTAARQRHWKRGEYCDVCRPDPGVVQQMTEHVCAGTGCVKLTINPRFCSHRCAATRGLPPGEARARRKAGVRARKLRHDETWDGVADEQIWDRDGWECQIPACTLPKSLRPDLRWPNDLYPNVDHIVPLDLGGADVASNKRAAHQFCNLSRGNRISPEDVLIVTPELAPLGLLPSRHGSPKPKLAPKLESPLFFGTCQLPDCGNLFCSRHLTKRYCSGKCYEEANRRRARLRYTPVVSRIGPTPLPWC